MRIYVSAADIKLGVEARHGSELLSFTCPVAQALKRIFPLNMVSVSTDNARVDRRCFWFSKRVQEIMHRFDLGKKIVPFSFAAKEQWL